VVNGLQGHVEDGADTDERIEDLDVLGVMHCGLRAGIGERVAERDGDVAVNVA
jgi:hypothetical protein